MLRRKIRRKNIIELNQSAVACARVLNRSDTNINSRDPAASGGNRLLRSMSSIAALSKPASNARKVEPEEDKEIDKQQEQQKKDATSEDVSEDRTREPRPEPKPTPPPEHIALGSISHESASGKPKSVRRSKVRSLIKSSVTPTGNRFKPNRAMRINHSLSPSGDDDVPCAPKVAFMDMKKESPSLPSWSRRITRQKASGQWNSRIDIRKSTSHPSAMLESKDGVNFSEMCQQETERRLYEDM